MSALRVSERQLELLQLVKDVGGLDSWGEAFSHWSTRMPGQLGMKNFDRIADALLKRKLIVEVEEYGTIELTDEGRSLLAREALTPPARKGRR